MYVHISDKLISVQERLFHKRHEGVTIVTRKAGSGEFLTTLHALADLQPIAQYTATDSLDQAISFAGELRDAAIQLV